MGNAAGLRSSLYIAIAASVAVAILPFGGLIGWPLSLLHTFVHELGHGFGGLLGGGTFESLELFWDGGGVAYTRGLDGDKLGRVLVLAGGLVGPAVAGSLFFFLALHPLGARVGLGLLGVLFLAALALWVRSSLGVVVAGGFGLVLLWAASQKSALVHQGGSAFLGLQLALSVFSRGDYLFMSGSFEAGDGQKRVTDIQKVADLLGGPVFFWGLVIGALSVVVVGAGAYAFWRAATRGERRT